MDTKHPPRTSIRWLLWTAGCCILGCEPPVEVRVYDAPKSDTQFVAGPLAGAPTNSPVSSPRPAATSGPRRILGAVIPMESGCYFLKATESPEKLDALLGDFHDIVTKFTINPNTGKPELDLPEGWRMNPRNDVAMAEFVAPESAGSIKFTVTVLAMPPASDWNAYLLSNINRWRGQLKLSDVDSTALADTLLSVERPGSLLPGYIFDAVGTGTGGMAPFAGGNPNPAPDRAPPSGSPTAPTANASAPPAGNSEARSGRPELQYETPSGWSLAAGTPFRLATFQIASEQGPGEVAISMAVDNPSTNAMMWYQQVTRETDEAKLKTMVDQSLQSSEKIPSGTGEGTLYTIRESEQPDAPMLLVASLPTDDPQLHLFVKLRADNRVAQSQRETFLKFIQTLSLK